MMLINGLMISVHTPNLTWEGFLGETIHVNQSDRHIYDMKLKISYRRDAFGMPADIVRLGFTCQSSLFKLLRITSSSFSSRLGELKGSRHEHNVDYTLLLLFLSTASESSSRGLRSAETNGQTAFPLERVVQVFGCY